MTRGKGKEAQCDSAAWQVDQDEACLESGELSRLCVLVPPDSFIAIVHL